MISSIVTCVLSVLALIGQVLSVAFPRWWIVETTVENRTETAHFGIWVTLDCFDGICKEDASNANGDKAWIEGVKVIEIFAVLFLFGAIVVSALSLLWRKNPSRLLMLEKLFTAFSGAAGTVVVMGVLIFFKKKAGLSPSQAIATKDGTADWALILSSISGVLSIVCSLLIGCKLIMKDSDIDDEIDYSKYKMDQKSEKINRNNLHKF